MEKLVYWISVPSISAASLLSSLIIMGTLFLTRNIPAVLEACSSAYRTLRKIRGIKHIPDLFYAINNEIVDLRLVLLDISEQCHRNKKHLEVVDLHLWISILEQARMMIHDSEVCTSSLLLDGNVFSFNQTAFLRNNHHFENLLEDLRRIRKRIIDIASPLTSKVSNIEVVLNKTSSVNSKYQPLPHLRSQERARRRLDILVSHHADISTAGSPGPARSRTSNRRLSQIQVLKTSEQTSERHYAPSPRLGNIYSISESEDDGTEDSDAYETASEFLETRPVDCKVVLDTYLAFVHGSKALPDLRKGLADLYTRLAESLSHEVSQTMKGSRTWNLGRNVQLYWRQVSGKTRAALRLPVKPGMRRIEWRCVRCSSETKLIMLKFIFSNVGSFYT